MDSKSRKAMWSKKTGSFHIPFVIDGEVQKFPKGIKTKTIFVKGRKAKLSDGRILERMSNKWVYRAKGNQMPYKSDAQRKAMFARHGVTKISNHNVTPELVDNNFEFSGKFQRLSNKEKRQYFEEKNKAFEKYVIKTTGLTFNELRKRELKKQ